MLNSKNAAVEWNNSVFNIPAEHRLYNSVPRLMVGFDTETTGLKNPEPISYGIVTYHNGIQHGHPEHFLAQPLDLENSTKSHSVPRHIEEGASDVHGWSDDSLSMSAHGNIVPLDDQDPAPELQDPKQFSKLSMSDVANRFYPPATHPKIAVNRAVNRLAHYMKQGAVLVGANPMYDLSVLHDTYKKYNNADISTSGLNLGFYRDKKGKLQTNAPVIDVIQHDRVLDPNVLPKDHPQYRNRKLTSLAQHYGVEPGGHKALDDARAAIDVYLKQVAHNVARSRM